MSFTPRLAVLVAAVVLTGLAQTGCGGEGPGSASGLGAERFEALEAIYEARLPLDQVEDAATSAQIREVGAIYSEVAVECERLATDDADKLLTAMIERCPLAAELGEGVTDSRLCGSRRECLTAVRALRARTARAVPAAREVDRELKAAKVSYRCRKVLRTSKDQYAALRHFRNALAEFERGLKNRSLKTLRRAGERLAKITDDDDEATSVARDLKRFRRACA